MGSGAEVIDVTDDDNFQSEWAEITHHAQESMNAVLAQYRFVGLLAGYHGPNGTDEDVTNARNAVFEALKDVFDFADKSAVGAQAEALAQTRNDTPIDSFNNKHLRATEPRSISDRDLESIKIYEAGGDPPAYTLGAHIAREDDLILKRLNRGQMSMEAYNAYFDQHQKAKNIFEAESARRQAERDSYVPWYSRLWSYLTKKYEDALEAIKSGRWLVGIAKLTIDAAIAAAEELVVNTLVAGIVALTGGLATWLWGIIRTGVKLMLSATRMASKLFRLDVRKVRKGSSDGQFEPDGPILDSRTVDVEKDLTPDERKALGEGGQGSTQKDVDGPETTARRPIVPAWIFRRLSREHDEMLEVVGKMDNNPRGPVLSSVIDQDTGKVFHGLNGSKPPAPRIPGALPDDLHPLLAARIAKFTDDIARTGNDPRRRFKDGGFRDGTPGHHSEVWAVNQALNERRRLGLPVDESVFQKLFLRNTRTATRGEILEKIPIVKCPNCASITKDVTDVVEEIKAETHR